MAAVGERHITKTDLAELEVRLTRLLQHYATKEDLAELKATIYQMEGRLIKWMVGILVGSVFSASSVAILLQRLIG